MSLQLNRDRRSDVAVAGIATLESLAGRHEMGARLALGATPRAVFASVVLRGLAPAPQSAWPVIALLACALPARRAAHIPPLDALRGE